MTVFSLNAVLTPALPRAVLPKPLKTMADSTFYVRQTLLPMPHTLYVHYTLYRLPFSLLLYITLSLYINRGKRGNKRERNKAISNACDLHNPCTFPGHTYPARGHDQHTTVDGDKRETQPYIR